MIGTIATPDRIHPAEGRTVIQVHHIDDVTVIHLDGDYDSMSESALDEVRETLVKEAETADPPRLVVDFSKTRFFGSSFIEILFLAFKRLKERDGRMAVSGMTPFCSEIFRAARIDLLWKSFPTIEEAVAGTAES